MGFIAITCKKCGAQLEVDESTTTYTCKYCRTVHERDYSNATPTPQSLGVMAERAIAKSEFGKALQFIEQGLTIDPHNSALLELEEQAKIGLATISDEIEDKTLKELDEIQNTNEAEQYFLQAQFILNELQANIQVYGSNSILSGATPANVDLGIQYIDRSLEHFPNNPAYLNLKALLLMEGKGMKDQGIALLEKAASINPRDITIQNNLKQSKTSSSCFIATAAYGSSMAQDVKILRLWRDEKLLSNWLGRVFVSTYYFLSPSIANFISNRPIAKRFVRRLLAPVVKAISKRQVIRA